MKQLDVLSWSTSPYITGGTILLHSEVNVTGGWWSKSIARIHSGHVVRHPSLAISASMIHPGTNEPSRIWTSSCGGNQSSRGLSG